MADTAAGEVEPPTATDGIVIDEVKLEAKELASDVTVETKGLTQASMVAELLPALCKHDLSVVAAFVIDDCKAEVFDEIVEVVFCCMDCNDVR